MSGFDRLIAATLPAIPKPVIRRFARPYIAGETLEDMVRVVRALEEDGFRATVDVLGEFSTRREQALSAVEAYQRVLDVLSAEHLEGYISVKLTQLGLKLDKELCAENLEALVAGAAAHGRFVRIDMEDSSCTEDTLELFFRVHRKLQNVGAVIQAYLRRSLADVRRLVAERASVRLCKGIYIEPRTIAYQDRDLVNANYTLLLEELLRGEGFVAIATHDERLVWEALRLIDRLGVGPDRYEFQMLLGVEEELRRILRDGGHPLRVYVPFGPHWHAYSVRRLRENPRIAGYVARDLFRGLLARGRRA